MPQFIGGPYDGMELPANPEIVRVINLPDPDSPLGFVVEGLVKESTSDGDWPYQYSVDDSVTPAVYRFVPE